MKKGVYKADAEKAGTGRGSEGLGQGNFELVANFGYIHEGQLTLAKAYVALHPEEAASGRFRR